MEAELKDLLEEVADLNIPRLEVRPFNQPNLITISSVNKTNENNDYSPYYQTAFNTFQVNLPRPILDVKALQLLSTNIPQCNNNIPNTACVFWYYRLSEYTGLTPTLNNLYYVRLLPSFYKQEYIYQPSQYGYNQTFSNYNSLNTQLVKSCATDLLLNNYDQLVEDDPITYTGKYVPFLPYDVSITYDASINKFKMTGLNTKVGINTYSSVAVYNIGDIVVDAGRTKAYVSLAASLGLAPATTPSAWVSGGTYDAYNIVSYAGKNYQSKAFQDPSTTPPDEDPANWDWITGDIWRRAYVDIIDEWSSTATYSAGIIVAYYGDTYKALVQNTNETPDNETYWVLVDYTNWYKYLITGYDDPNVAIMQGEFFDLEWNAYTTYTENEIITYKGRSMKALYTNRNFIPEIPLGTMWDSGTAYITNDYVYYGSIVYQAIVGNTNKVPLNNLAYWKPLGKNTPEWNILSIYSINDYVYLGNEIFKSRINSNVGNTPSTSPTDWEVAGLTDAWEFNEDGYALRSGLYGLTSAYDMTEFIGNSAIISNFPYGVGGQPYNPNPKRLLNSVLGFTWNGQFTPSDFANIGEYDRAVLTQTKFPLLYNHLRPVPTYIVSIPVVLGFSADAAASTSLTYTADSYCNLVYSSIVNIYANVVGASAVDTQRQSGLLAITSMNCGNLGVAFWDNYIDNPLMKVEGDIYTLVIEFRDEFDEPFMLSNNAVATLVFKATYK